MFKSYQLSKIKEISLLESREVGVYNTLKKSHSDEFHNYEMNIIKFCAEECARQRSGPESVSDMIQAWDYAMNLRDADDPPKLTIFTIEDIGQLVEPVDNQFGFRTVPVGVSDGFTFIEKAHWERVPSLVNLLLETYYDGSLWVGGLGITHKLSKRIEDEFYLEFEEIHPFMDGNGRSGKILYNYLCDTLTDPIMPPNFWNILNP